MSTHTVHSPHSWIKIGNPPAGMVTAVALADDGAYSAYVGTKVGLYRSTGFERETFQGWERLPNAPLGVICLALSPDYSNDYTIIAGTSSGIYVSRNSGENWRATHLPLSSSVVLALEFSPDYLQDGIIMAGTLEDGVLLSHDRGENWQSQGFGLIDSTVYCLAFSPGYAQDGTIFIGTDTTLYYSYNRARAWKQLGFPDEVAPVLSLAVSPNFMEDQTLYAGTEGQGLFRSVDRGKSWEKITFPVACVNVLSLSKSGRSILAATDGGVYLSGDEGMNWECLVSLANTIGIAEKDDLLLAGTVESGVWMKTDRTAWVAIPDFSSRSMLGMVLSTQFYTDGTAFMYGPQEGIWRTRDGGLTWESVDEVLSGLDIRAIALSPDFARNQILTATASAGLLLSTDAGTLWRKIADEPSGLATFSPNGKILAVNFPGIGIRLSEDFGTSWHNTPGPWEAGGVVLALSVANDHHVYAALLEGIGETVSIWQGKPGDVAEVLSLPADVQPLVSFWVPPEPAADRPWFAGVGSVVWKFSSRRKGALAKSQLSSGELNEKILAITGIQEPSGQTLLACTGQRIYKSQSGEVWKQVCDFGSERAVSIALSPSFAQDKTIYTLLLGGTFCKVVIR